MAQPHRGEHGLDGIRSPQVRPVLGWEVVEGELAKQCGVNIETLRFYEQRGLLPKPLRSSSNYRLYPHDSVRRVRFIKGAQELGFTLKEIKELLDVYTAAHAAS